MNVSFFDMCIFHGPSLVLSERILPGFSYPALDTFRLRTMSLFSLSWSCSLYLLPAGGSNISGFIGDISAL